MSNPSEERRVYVRRRIDELYSNLKMFAEQLNNAPKDYEEFRPQLRTYLRYLQAHKEEYDALLDEQDAWIAAETTTDIKDKIISWTEAKKELGLSGEDNDK